MAYKKITDLPESTSIVDTDYFILETSTETKKVLATKFKDYLPPKRMLGQIIMSTIPITSSSLHLLDGSLLTNTDYPDFVAHVAALYALYPTAAYFTTEAQWQTVATTYGVCGKFVYDTDNSTVRIPKVNCVIQGSYDSTTLGDVIQYTYNTGSSTFNTLKQLQYLVVKEVEA